MRLGYIKLPTSESSRSILQVSLVVGVVEEGSAKNNQKVSKAEVGPPWRGLTSGQLLTSEVLDLYIG